MAFKTFSGRDYHVVSKPVWIFHNNELPRELGEPVINQRFEAFSFFGTKRPIGKGLNSSRFTYFPARVASSLASAILGAQDFLQCCYGLPNPTLNRIVVIASRQLEKPTFTTRDDFRRFPFCILHQISDLFRIIHLHRI